MKYAPAAATMMLLACAGCSIALDENSGIYAAQPGKYDYLDCAGLAKTTQANARREAELTALMERSSREATGTVVNALVYQDQLNMARSNRLAAQKAADEKRCAPDIKPQSAGMRSLD
jgi:hypothetical protein